MADSNFKVVTVKFLSGDEGYKVTRIDPVDALPDDLGVDVENDVVRVGLTFPQNPSDPVGINGLDIIRNPKGMVALEARAKSGRCNASVMQMQKRFKA